jgi:hypothetical protein
MDHSSLAQYRVYRRPKIGEQGCRVAILVSPDRPQALAMVLRLAALPLRHWMRVVEPDQPLAVWPVQR